VTPSGGGASSGGATGGNTGATSGNSGATSGNSGATSGVNLASRRLGASVIAASDEFFGEKEDLLRPTAPVTHPHAFGHKGQTVDGWETRRRRGTGHDFALVRLGAAGVIHGVVVDTAHFTGNYPAASSVQACAADGYPSPEDLCAASMPWVEIVPRSPLAGDTENIFAVRYDRWFTHVRLNIYPDGGVARLRVHGEVVPDPRLLDGVPLDLVAQENGGTVIDASDRFYSAPENVIAPGRADKMGDGWETRRRRDVGNDWVLFKLTAAGHIRQVVIDTSYFIGNAPAACALRACDATVSVLDVTIAGPGQATGNPDMTATGPGQAAGNPDVAVTGPGPTIAGQDAAEWFDLLPRTRLQADTRHRFRIGAAAAARRATHVLLEIYPDGGLARLQLFGEFDTDGRACVGVRWFDRLPADHAMAVLIGECGLAESLAAALAGGRPYRKASRLEALLADRGLPGADTEAVARVRSVILGRWLEP